MTKQSVIHVEEGRYVIHVRTLQEDKDEPSAMAGYLSESAIITNLNGSLSLTLMLKDHQTITGFQVENQEAIEKQVNDETNMRFEMFELDRLPAYLPVRVQYEVEYGGKEIKSDEALRLYFDEASLEEDRKSTRLNSSH